MKFSMSGTERVAMCPPSAVLPQTRKVSHASARGTAIHAFLAAVPEVGRPQALELVPEEHRAACAAIELHRLPACSPGDWASEVSFAYNLLLGTAREIGRGLNRSYEGRLQPGEIPGTADVVGLSGQRVLVLDYKTGWKPLGPPAASWQLRCYALAAARAYGCTSAFVGFIRIKETGEPWFDCAELSAEDLQATAEELRRIAASVESAAQQLAAGRMPTTSEGAWCEYCPAFGSCPAQADLARALAAPEGFAQSLPVLSLETAPLIWERLGAARKVLEYVEASIKLFAAESPVPLPDGYVLGPKLTPRESIRPEALEEVLTAIFGPQAHAIVEAATRVKVDVTKRGLQEALTQFSGSLPGVSPSKIFEATMDELRRRGAVSVTYSQTVMRHRPKRNSQAA